MTPSQTCHDLPSLTVRRLHIDLSKGFARHWNGGDAFRTAFCNALSMSFPVGEQFFIDAVREGAKRLPDTPDNANLHAVVRGFIGQEATHRHLHGLYNAHLEKQGLVNHWGPRIARRLEQARSQLFGQSPKAHLHELALTAAYEHFTAVFGELTLAHMDQPGDVLYQAQEPLQTLWRWHAAEESEHKSVAFELYVRLGGNYAWRMRWFVYMAVQFTLDVMRQTLNNLWRDRTLHKPSTWLSAVRTLFGRHGLAWRSLRPMAAYCKRDFHPEQQGDAALPEAWLQAHRQQWSPVGAAKAPETLSR